MRTHSMATFTIALLITAGCGSTPEEPEAALVIITTDKPANTTDHNNGVEDPSTNNTTTLPDPEPEPEPEPHPDPNNNIQPDPDPDPDPDPLEPCGNGVLDAGELCDGNCPTNCDDGDPCTMGAMSGSAALCTAVCEYQADPACDAWEGTYSGTYFIKAEEKVGASVINSMTCIGTFTASVDMTRDDNLTGTASCAYGGSLTIFDANQSATIAGKIAPNGTFTARIQHDSGAPNSGNFSVSGALAGGALTVDGTGSYRPHPQSAVGWETVIKLD